MSKLEKVSDELLGKTMTFAMVMADRLESRRQSVRIGPDLIRVYFGSKVSLFRVAVALAQLRTGFQVHIDHQGTRHFWRDLIRHIHLDPSGNFLRLFFTARGRLVLADPRCNLLGPMELEDACADLSGKDLPASSYIRFVGSVE